MLTIDGKQYRNLEEQVQKNKSDIEFLRDEQGVLNQFGIKVIGTATNRDAVPSVEDYKENNPNWEYGDTYAVGQNPPYELLVLTRANVDRPEDYWFDIGDFPLAGPKGDKGDAGSTGPAGPAGPAGQQGVQGVQGIPGVQGLTGPAGPAGPAGPRGEQGVPGESFRIIAQLSSTSQLPTPTEENRNEAYLVEIDSITHLFVIVGDNTLEWVDAGPIEGIPGPKGDKGDTGSTGPAGPAGPAGPRGEQGVQGIPGKDATITNIVLQSGSTQGTLTEEQLALIQQSTFNYLILDNECYLLMDNQVASGYLVYSHVGQDSTNNYFIKCITITVSTRGWVMSSTQVGGGGSPKVSSYTSNTSVLHNFLKTYATTPQKILGLYISISYGTQNIVAGNYTKHFYNANDGTDETSTSKTIINHNSKHFFKLTQIDASNCFYFTGTINNGVANLKLYPTGTFELTVTKPSLTYIEIYSVDLSLVQRKPSYYIYYWE